MQEVLDPKEAILLTGSSGFLGRRLIRLLVERNRPVIALYRNQLPESLNQVYPVLNNCSNSELLKAPLRGVDTVYHLAWANNFIGNMELPQELSQGKLTANLLATQNLIQAMEKNHTKRLIFVSALGASRASQSLYLREKYLAEVLILNSKIPEKVIVRSALVYGEDHPFIKTILRFMRFPAFYPVPKVDHELEFVHVNDLARALAKMGDSKSKSRAQIIEIIGSEGHKVEDVFKFVSKSYAKGSRWPIKGFLGQNLMPLVERGSPHSKSSSPRLLDFLTLRSQKSQRSGADFNEIDLKEYGLNQEDFRKFGDDFSPQKNLT